MNERLSDHRRLCSDLVVIKRKNNKGKELIYPALLEEIAPSGASVQLDFPIPARSWVRLECPTAEYTGVVSKCQWEQELGYFVGIEFEPGQRWSPDQYKPRYYVDPLELCPNQQPPNSDLDGLGPCRTGECVREICPREIMTLTINPEVRLRQTVSDVASEVAVLCGDLDERGLQRCFSRLFRIGPHCLLSGEFTEQYRAARERIRKLEDPKLDAIDRIQSIAKLLSAVPKEALGYRNETRPPY